MTIVIDPACTLCSGTGHVTVDYGSETCPRCRLQSRYQTRWCDSCHEERPAVGMTFMRGELTRTEYAVCADCQSKAKAAHEASVEAAWKELRDSGADELTLRTMAGDR